MGYEGLERWQCILDVHWQYTLGYTDGSLAYTKRVIIYSRGTKNLRNSAYEFVVVGSIEILPPPQELV